MALVREPSVGAMLDAILSNPPSAPLYALLLRAWVGLAGHGDVAIRLPSVIAGTLAIPAAAWLAREVDGRRRVAVLAAAFVALSPYALEFSQEAAPYMLAALLTTLALAAGWRWRRHGQVRDGTLAVGLAILAVYSHYVAVVVLGLAWVGGLSRRSGPTGVTVRRWVLAGVIVGAAWLPWAVGLAQHWAASAAPRAALSSPATLRDLAGALPQYVSGTAALLLGARWLLLAGLGLGAGLIAFGWWAGRDPRRRGLRVIVASAALVFVLPAIVSALTGRWLFVAHFGLLTLPAMLVVVAAGAVELGRVGIAREGAARRLGSTLAVAWCLVAAVGIVLFRLAPPHGDDDLRELVATIENLGASGDPVLVAPAILTPSLAQYTDRPLTGIPAAFDLRNIYGPAARPPSPDELRAATRAAATGQDRVWLVTRDDLDLDGVIPAQLATEFTPVARLETEFATLYRFEASE